MIKGTILRVLCLWPLGPGDDLKEIASGSDFVWNIETFVRFRITKKNK